MLEINSRLAVIDGWLVDIVERKPINFGSPEVRLLLPNDDDYAKVLQQELVNWTQLKKNSKSVLVGVSSVELFKHVKLTLRDFFLLEDGRVVLKRIRSKLHYKVVRRFARRCCRLLLPRWGTVYIYPMLQGDQVCLDRIRQFSSDIEPNLEYPLIDINGNNQYIIMEGFFLHLNQMRLCKWNTNDLRDQVGLKTWFYLKKLYNPVSLDIVYNLDSNYYFVKDDQFFQLLGKRAFVKFCKVEKNKAEDTAPFYYCARTTTAKASHIAYILTSVTQGSFTNKKGAFRFIVRERPITEDINSNVRSREVKKQVCAEIKVIEAAFSTYISQLEKQLMQNIDQEQKTNFRVRMISGEALDQIRSFPVSKNTLSLIATGENRKYIKLVEELAKRLEKVCVEKTTQSLENIRDTFHANSDMRTKFDKEYYKTIQEYKGTLQLIEEDTLLALIRQLGNRMLPEKKLTREEYVSPRFLVADGFLIDLAEEKPINPKDPRLLILLKDFQRDILNQMNLLTWDDFKAYQDPIALHAKTLFKFCKQVNKLFLRDADFKLHLSPPGANLTDSQVKILYPCVPICLDDNTVRYIYDDSIVSKSENASSVAVLPSNSEWGKHLDKDPELHFQQAIKRMRLLTTYEELKTKYIGAFEDLRTDNNED